MMTYEGFEFKLTIVNVYAGKVQVVFPPSRTISVLLSWPDYEQARSPENKPGQLLKEVEINDSGL
jgi:hypothetical protein